MSLLERLKWWVAPKEMGELHRWRSQWEEHRRWLAEFEHTSATLESLYLHPAPIPEVKDAFPQAHRLALELECLILSCKDTVAVSKWWDSANEALEQWREFNEAASGALELQDNDGGSRAGYERPVCRQCDCVGCKTPAARSE